MPDLYDSLGLSADVDLEDVFKHLVRYVDFAHGSDANRGLSAGRAKKTIQAAYDDLKAAAGGSYTAEGGRLGVGTIVLLPGVHDVGTGVLIDWDRPVAIKGTRSGPRDHAPQNTASRVISSSAAVVRFFNIAGESASQITRGVSFEDISFRMDHTLNTALTSIIRAKRVGYLTVERCSFTNNDLTTNVSVSAILHEDSTTSDGEGGWCRIRDNACSRMQLYRSTTGGSGGNFNRGRISDNVVFYGGSLPMIHIDANTNGYLVDGNNLEGTAVGIEVGPNGTYTQNTFLNNSGEDSSSGTPANPFYKFTASVSQQLIIGGICSAPSASGAGTWISFGANAYRNIVIGVLDFTAVTTTHKRFVSETAHADKNLLLPTNVAMTTYTATNVTTDRSYDADTVAVAELADIVGTLIADLRARGFVK